MQKSYEVTLSHAELELVESILSQAGDEELENEEMDAERLGTIRALELRLASLKVARA